MPAERKEVVLRPDLIDAEDLGEDAGTGHKTRSFQSTAEQIEPNEFSLISESSHRLDTRGPDGGDQTCRDGCRQHGDGSQRIDQWIPWTNPYQ